MVISKDPSAVVHDPSKNLVDMVLNYRKIHLYSPRTNRYETDAFKHGDQLPSIFLINGK